MARALQADEKLRPRIKRRKSSWRSGMFDKAQKHERMSRFFDQSSQILRIKRFRNRHI
jgi:hypothetical protein